MIELTRIVVILIKFNKIRKKVIIMTCSGILAEEESEIIRRIRMVKRWQDK